MLSPFSKKIMSALARSKERIGTVHSRCARICVADMSLYLLPGIAWIRLLLPRKDVHTHVAVALYGRRLRCCPSFGKKF
jgi:hypothetical protein